MLLFALVSSILFNTPIAGRVTMACAVTGSVLFFAGRMANFFGRVSIMSQKPGWVSGLRIFASVLGPSFCPSLFFGLISRSAEGDSVL